MTGDEGEDDDDEAEMSKHEQTQHVHRLGRL